MDWYYKFGICVAISFAISVILNPSNLNEDKASFAFFSAIFYGGIIFVAYEIALESYYRAVARHSQKNKNSEEVVK